VGNIFITPNPLPQGEREQLNFPSLDGRGLRGG